MITMLEITFRNGRKIVGRMVKYPARGERVQIILPGDRLVTITDNRARLRLV